MQELVESVKQLGILQPLLVRPIDGNKYELVAGERRYRAASSLGLTEIPVVIRELTDTEASGGDKRPRTFTGKAFCTIGPPQKFRLSDKIISRVKSAGVVIKKKGLTNTTRPQSIISCPHSITQFSKNI